MRKLRLIGLLLLAWFAAQTVRLLPTAQAKEPIEAFTDALCRRGMYDEAELYLGQLSADPAISAETKRLVAYELGFTLVQSADSITDASAKAKRLEEGIEKLKQFVAAYEKDSLAAAADSLLGSALLDYGRVKIALARQADGEKNAPLSDENRRLFDEARQRFAAADKRLTAQLEKIPKLLGPEETELKAEKDRLAGEVAQAQLLGANVDFELASAAPRNSPEAKTGFKASAAAYAKLYENYRTRGAGLYAHFWEARCYQELCDLKHALGCYLELMDLPDTKDGRALKARIRMQSLRHALECWNDPSLKDYAQAREYGEDWIKSTTGIDVKDPDALAIRYLTALAVSREIAVLPEKDSNRKKMAQLARGYLALATKQAGEHQQLARTLLAELGGKQSDDVQAASFAEARNLGKESLARMQAASRALKENPQADPQLRKELEESRADTVKQFRLALALADKTTTLEDLTLARYILCFLMWDSGEYYDAAVLGEFLARNYSDAGQGREGANIALAAYEKLYTDSEPAEKPFEVERIVDLSEYIIQRWPKDPLGQQAAQTLMHFTLQQRDTDKALAMAAKIPADSPARGEAELKIGQSLWAAYLRDSQVPANERPKGASPERLKTQAQQVLARGIDRMKAEPKVSYTLVVAVLSLAQISLDATGPDKAIALLEDEKIGPLTLLRKKDALTQREGFAVETYKTALRAYVAARQTKKAEEVMDLLERMVGSDPKAAETLTKIYISMGRDLQQQLQELRKSGKTADLEAVSQSFEAFLSRIAKRQTDVSFSTLNWVAETFASLGGGNEEAGTALSPQAKKYYEQAVESYRRILAETEKNPRFAPQPGIVSGVRLRLANCYRRLGDYNEAVKLIADVLSDKKQNTNLTAQIQAAETLQAWGAVNPMGYVRAIKGTHPDKKDGNFVIWGWMKLAQQTLDRPEFEAQFFQARLQQAECHYRYGLQHKDEAGIASFNLAKQDIGSTYRYRPGLGGTDSFQEFERLLKKVQEALKEEPIGIREFKNPEATSSGAQASK